MLINNFVVVMVIIVLMIHQVILVKFQIVKNMIIMYKIVQDVMMDILYLVY